MYFVISLVANVAGGVFSGIQFARMFTALKDNDGKDRDTVLPFSFGLLAFAIPFFSPISGNIGASASFFIALSAVSTLIASRTVR